MVYILTLNMDLRRRSSRCRRWQVVEKIVEVPQTQVHEVIKHVPKVQVQEVVRHVPKVLIDSL